LSNKFSAVPPQISVDDMPNLMLPGLGGTGKLFAEFIRRMD